MTDEAWSRGNKARLLLMDVKGAFDHVSRNYLLRQMERIGVDGNLMEWVN